MSMALDDKQQGHDDEQLPELAEPRSTAEVAEALQASGMVDELLAQIDTGQVQITGDGGLIPGLIKLALERGLKAELTDHLGYDKGDPAGRELPNARNGSTPKTVASEAGPVELNVPRDRDGTFTPRLVPKGSRRLGGLDDIIISLYAGGMTLRDIQHHLASTIGTDLSHETISKICDEVLDAVDEWQNRPLEALYPIIYLDALVVKVKDGSHVRNKHAHIAIGVDMGGIKHVLGIWIQAEEGAKFWAGVCANLANRGVRDVLIVCCDGLTGFPEAIEATWPLATVQTCVVHLIRNSMRFVNYKDRKDVARAIKPIYTAPTAAAAAEALDAFDAEWGHRYPAAIRLWRNAWQEFIPFLDYDIEVRKVICSTNAIESLNARYRRAVRARGHFPNEQSALKCLYLVTRSLDPTGTGQKRWTMRWKPALNAFAITFADRMPASEDN